MKDLASAVSFWAPEDPAVWARLLRALALGIAAGPPPAAVLFETSDEQPLPRVTAGPQDLIEATLTAPVFRQVRCVGPVGAEPLADSAILWTESWALAPTDGRPSYTAGPGVWDAPELAGVIGPGGRMDTQTFWLGGRTDGRLWVARQVRYGAPDRDTLEHRSTSVGRIAAAEWSLSTGVLCRPTKVRCTPCQWASGSSRAIPRRAWLAIPPLAAGRTAQPTALHQGVGPAGSEDGHTVALGASGAGKTTYLSDRAARAIRLGGTVLALDLHGDLTPSIVARLSPAERSRIVAVDVSQRPIPGLAALAAGSDRAAAQLVAAVKRLTPDGSDVYWGFRLERVFDAFTRLVQDSGGSLGDLYALLTDADRRDSARLATKVPELARFLSELEPIVRRTPEFLWSAAARLAKVVLVPELSELLSPTDGGLPVEDLLDERRSILVRIPYTAVGPEAAGFAGSLVLARCYLGLAARRGPLGPQSPVAVVLDEVQGLSPRLVSEMLTEGRKYGLRLIVASQYPERLAPELRQAAAGVSRTVVGFQVPAAGAAGVGSWLGLSSSDSERVLPQLPVGFGVRRDPGTGELRPVHPQSACPGPRDEAWNELVARTQSEFPGLTIPESWTVEEGTERLLLAILASDEQGRGVPLGHLVDEALRLPGTGLDRAVLDDRASQLERVGLATRDGGLWHLTPSGERRLGLRPVTGATTESAEHRALLMRAFRVFARHGHRLEIIRQGRYDTRLPDAVLHQLPARRPTASPRELAGALALAERTWAWRAFGGRDVHVEAEVTGALRPSRIRHGLRKAQAADAFALFVVGDAHRASRIRKTLQEEGLSPLQAQVWTLRGAEATEPREHAQDGKPRERSTGP